MEKMVLGTPCYIPQGGFLSSGNILRYAERSVPGRSRKLHRAGEPGLLSGRNQRWRKPNQHIRKAVSHWHWKTGQWGPRLEMEMRVWREPELLTGGDHRLDDGEGAHKCESPLSVWTQGSYLNSLCLLSFTVKKDAGGSTDSEGSCRGWVRNYKWSTLSQCLAWRMWPFNVNSYYQNG